MRASIEPGERFGASRRVTAQDLELAIALTGGRHPVHTDEAAARAAGQQGRVLHGAVSAAMMTAAIGERFRGDRIALLSQCQRYRKPVYPGDTLHSLWTVTEAQPARRPPARLLTLSGELRNQHGELVLDGQAQVLLR